MYVANIQQIYQIGKRKDPHRYSTATLPFMLLCRGKVDPAKHEYVEKAKSRCRAMDQIRASGGIQEGQH
jgi:hypothetical protein